MIMPIGKSWVYIPSNRRKHHQKEAQQSQSTTEESNENSQLSAVQEQSSGCDPYDCHEIGLAGLIGMAIALFTGLVVVLLVFRRKD